MPQAVPALEDIDAVNTALRHLLKATLRREAKTAERDQEIAAIQTRLGPALEKASNDIALYTAQIEQYCLAHPEEMAEGTKCRRLQWGVIGLRSPTNPALVPISDKWSWEAIAEKVHELWKNKFFAPPKPRALDKMKLKKALGSDEKALRQCGLKLDDAERPWFELERPKTPDELAVMVSEAA